jgi:hypothetical protein
MQNEPFPITPELRQQAVDTLADIIENGSPADQIAACEILVQMVAQNVESESRDRPTWN